MKTILAFALLAAGTAFAGTISLPDPSVYVNLVSNRTTVGIAGVYYQAPSQFVYFSECAKPDGLHYHCNIMVETGVVLYSNTGASVVANITAQFSSTLITSGHNWWRQSQVVLAGDVTTP